MKRHRLLNWFGLGLFIGLVAVCTSCVNSISEDDSPDRPDVPAERVPITFKVKSGTSSTRAEGSYFSEGAQIGLYAMLTGTAVSGERYIDNAELLAGAGNVLVPTSDLFYPEGTDNALDFISYFPYRPEGAAAGEATVAVSLQSDQTSAANYLQSDFLLAKKDNKAADSNTVELEYEHKLTKVCVVLTPGVGESAADMLKASPRLIATDFYTRGSYNLMTGEIRVDEESKADIYPSGTWKIEEGKLVGKEFIVFPQSVSSRQMLQLEWNGRVYSCMVTAEESQDVKGKQFVIDVNLVQKEAGMLAGVIAGIKDWPTEAVRTESAGGNDYKGLHLDILSFSTSNVYRVHASNKPVAEICLEYLKSDDLNSRAIVTYPLDAEGKSEMDQGTLLRLLDSDEAVCGGTLRWDEADNTFSYTAGTSPGAGVVYFDADGGCHLSPEGQMADVSVVRYTIRDTRDGSIVEYPVVKIGTQYWMRSNLQATLYRDRRALQQIVSLGSTPGYLHADGSEFYFYNGEALLQGELSPSGWKIPSKSDWEKLEGYVGGDASLLKDGTWGYLGNSTNGETQVAPVLNSSMMHLLPSGMWFNGEHYAEGRMSAFWSLEEDGTIPDKTVFFTGQENTVIWNGTKITGQDYYKGLSIRCVRK